MKLHAPIYVSPVSTEGTFTDVFIEDSIIEIQKRKKILSVTFEMYYLRDGVPVVLEETTLKFTSYKETAIISIANGNYQAEVDAVPLTIEIVDPENPGGFIEIPDPENPEGFITVPDPANPCEFITVTNPDYEAQVAAVPTTLNVPLLQYLAENEGTLPEEYEVVNYGWPDYATASYFFEGGDKANPDITIPNPFAKEWLLNCAYLKTEAFGKQFSFIE